MSDNRMGRLLKLWFTFEVPVDRRTYLVHGSLLMAVKYAVDATVVWLATGTFWLPSDYLSPFLGDRVEQFAMPIWVFGALLVWSLPFLWIGVGMTMRRLMDAGRSPWLALLFFVPGVNYLLLAILCALPSRRTGDGLGPEREPAPVLDDRLKSAAAGIALAVAIAVGMTAVSVLVLGFYGATLFLGTPFVMGLVAAYIHNRGHARTWLSTHQVALLAVVLAGGVLLLYGIEGLLCIGLAFPLALTLAILGAVAGRVMALRLPVLPRHGFAAVSLLPLLAAAETLHSPQDSHVVRTTVEIDAPPSVVWGHVVAFSELPEPAEWIFRLGIAYPRRARIEGAGVGAVRRCEFSTGAFVEPITVWDEPRRLAFDVREQPAPLQEWSPYAGLHPPHLDGYFRSQRGEFLLVALPGGRTRLEGRTWYGLTLYPQVYWRLYADALIHGIHRRVLTHVKRQAESPAHANAM